jgi:hypothetical protein
MAWLSWEEGRRKTGYFKMLLARARWPFGWDAYLLRFPPKSSAPWHTDEVPGFRHYRINFVLKRAKRGGRFQTDYPVYIGKRLKIFRSDKPHEVQQIQEGTRYILSIGVVFREKKHFKR